MRAVRNSLVLIAASMVMAGIVSAQDSTASFNQQNPTNYFANVTLDSNREPQVLLDSNMQITGLLVDCVKPQVFWAMLNSPAPAEVKPETLPTRIPEAKAPHLFNDNLAVHEPDFILFRLSFR